MILIFKKLGDVAERTLSDIRDGNTYTVRKLADGNCWMTSDLQYASTTQLSGHYYYNTAAANNACPTAFHMPTPDEWESLAALYNSRSIFTTPLSIDRTAYIASGNYVSTSSNDGVYYRQLHSSDGYTQACVAAYNSNNTIIHFRNGCGCSGDRCQFALRCIADH